ncbi:hypothetical protein GCM10007984_12030 [Shewanella putrefaciens]|nr:hypothetical protein GCM10007984_12030 [Shewanella putrefaciens]
MPPVDANKTGKIDTALISIGLNMYTIFKIHAKTIRSLKSVLKMTGNTIQKT